MKSLLNKLPKELLIEIILKENVFEYYTFDQCKEAMKYHKKEMEKIEKKVEKMRNEHFDLLSKKIDEKIKLRQIVHIDHIYDLDKVFIDYNHGRILLGMRYKNNIKNKLEFIFAFSLACFRTVYINGGSITESILLEKFPTLKEICDYFHTSEFIEELFAFKFI
jgi:translation elongation factor EF-Ts